MTSNGSVPQRHGWLTANLIAQLAFGLLAMTINLPSMQDWPATFEASQAAVQLTFSGFVAAYGGLQLLYGPLSDRFGRKPLLLFGLGVAGFASVLAAFAPNLAVLTVARVLQGAGSAAGMVIGRALVQDLFTGPERTRMMAFVGMVMGVCPPAATLLGGHLHVSIGWRANFVVMAVLAAFLFVAAWRGLPAVRPAGERPRGPLFAGYGQLLRERRFLLYVTIMACTTATFYTFLGGAPIVLKAYGVSPERIGWYIATIPLAYIVGNLWTTRLIRVTTDRSIMGFGQAWTLTGLAIVLALGIAGTRSPLALALPLILLGIGHGLLAPPALTGTVGLIPALAGAAAAVAGLMQQASGAFGSFIVGLVPHDGQLQLGVLMIAWGVMGCAAQLVLFRVVMARPAPAGRTA